MNIKPLDVLHKYYGYTSFRKGQENMITSIINKEDVLAIMPISVNTIPVNSIFLSTSIFSYSPDLKAGTVSYFPSKIFITGKMINTFFSKRHIGYF